MFGDPSVTFVKNVATAVTYGATNVTATTVATWSMIGSAKKTPRP